MPCFAWMQKPCRELPRTPIIRKRANDGSERLDATRHVAAWSLKPARAAAVLSKTGAKRVYSSAGRWDAAAGNEESGCSAIPAVPLESGRATFVGRREPLWASVHTRPTSNACRRLADPPPEQKRSSRSVQHGVPDLVTLTVCPPDRVIFAGGARLGSNTTVRCLTAGTWRWSFLAYFAHSPRSRWWACSSTRWSASSARGRTPLAIISRPT